MGRNPNHCRLVNRCWNNLKLAIAANMDTVGTFELAAALASLGLFTCIHKHYTVDEWAAWAADHPELLNSVAVSSGTSEEDAVKLEAILNRVSDSEIELIVLIFTSLNLQSNPRIALLSHYSLPLITTQ